MGGVGGCGLEIKFVIAGETAVVIMVEHVGMSYQYGVKGDITDGGIRT
jgi:hypothetical protein